jgi:hypothetical protein
MILGVYTKGGILNRIPLHVGLVCLIGTLGCSGVRIADFRSWCQYIHDPEGPQYDAFAFYMDTDSVIADLVSTWDRIIIENNAYVLGVPSSKTESDSVISELRRLRIVGAWQTSDTLHLAVGVVPSALLHPERSDADLFAEEYSRRLQQVREPDARRTMEAGTYCLYEGIEIFFAQLSIHAPDGVAQVSTDTYHRLKDSGFRRW